VIGDDDHLQAVAEREAGGRSDVTVVWGEDAPGRKQTSVKLQEKQNGKAV